MMNRVEYVFTCSFVIWISSLVECLFKPFPHFFLIIVLLIFFVFSGHKFFIKYVIFKCFLQSLLGFHFHNSVLKRTHFKNLDKEKFITIFPFFFFKLCFWFCTQGIFHIVSGEIISQYYFRLFFFSTLLLLPPHSGILSTHMLDHYDNVPCLSCFLHL